MKNAKKTLARKLLSREEVKKKCPIFTSNNWDLRKDARAEKVANKIAKAKARKIERLSKQEVPSKKVVKKLSPAEQKQLKRKVKMIKFADKIKNLIK